MAPRADSRGEQEPGVRQSGASKAAERGRKSRVGVNAIVNAAGSLSYHVAVVLVTPIALGQLGEKAWGIWQLVGATAGFAMLLNLGLNSAVSYQVSRSLAADDLDLVAKSIHNARIFLTAVAGLILLLLAIGGRPLIDSLVDAADTGTAHVALVLSVGLAAVTVPARMFPSVLSGLQRYDLLAIFRIITGALLFAAVLLGLRVGMGLLGFVVAMSLMPSLPAILSWLASRHILPRQCFRWQRSDFPYLLGMVRYSMSTLLYTTGSVVLYQSMKLIAAWRCGGPVAAGHIGLAENIAQILSVLFIPLAGVLHTRISDLHGRGLHGELAPLLQRALAATGMLAVPTVVFLGFEAETVFEAWVGTGVGPGVISELAVTLRYMLVGQGLYAVFLPCFYALLGLGQHRVFGLSMLAASVVNAAAGWLATQAVPEINALGLVFGLTLSVMVLGATLPATLRRFAIRPSRVMLESLLIPLAVSAPGSIALLWRPQMGHAIVDLALAGVIFGICTLPGLALMRRRVRGSAEKR